VVSDDEAFIRVIVDRPGDDLPRLVYADWLDERGDPRGEYLHIEMELVKEAKKPQADGTVVFQWVELSDSGLDPVWAARVSRPPVGVCCDHVRFTERGRQLTSDDIRAAEQALSVQLPAEYQAFLLNYNGGRPDPFEFTWGSPESEFERVSEFAAISTRGADNDSMVRFTQQIRERGIPAAEAPVFVAWDPHCGSHSARYHMLSTAGERAGQIAAWESWSPDDLGPYGMTLPEWLASLRHASPKWVRLIYRGDREGVRRWLDDEGSVEARDGTAFGIGRSLLDFAAEYNQPEIARDLLDRGARVDQTMWAQITNGTYPLVEWMRNIEQPH
jgi:uncharacterized protein (TIGR02996 family)